MKDPELEGPTIRLRNLSPTDSPVLHRLITDPAVMLRWRFRGSTPSPETIYNSLWIDTLVQFVIEDKRSSQAIGLFSCTNADFRNGSAEISLLAHPRTFGRGQGIEAAAFGIVYLFRAFPFRKLYADVPQFNYAQFSSGADKFFKIEGRKLQHEYSAGAWWDLVTLAFYREEALEGLPAVFPNWLSSEQSHLREEANESSS